MDTLAEIHERHEAVTDVERKLLDLQPRGRTIEAEVEFEKLLGALHVKPAMGELSKSDRGDESGAVKLSELLFGCHARVMFIGSALFTLQQLSDINVVLEYAIYLVSAAGLTLLCLVCKLLYICLNLVVYATT